MGAAILAALSVARKTLSRGLESGDGVDVDMHDAAQDGGSIENRIRGLERLVPHPIDLASFAPPSADLFEKAACSARKCVCEGRLGTSTVAVYRCPSCDHTSCASCRGRPIHKYVEDGPARVRPEVFESELKTMLPMRLSLAGFSLGELRAKLSALKDKGVLLREDKGDCSNEKFCEAVAAAVDGLEVSASYC